MAKLSLKSALFFMLLFTLISCGKSNTKLVLNTSEGVENINKLLKSEFDLEKEITSLSITNNSRTSNEVEQVTIAFTENNKNTIWFYSFAMAKLFKPKSKEKSKKEAVKMLKLKEFNTSEIITYFNKAVEMVKKETDEFENFQLGNYYMEVNQNTNKIEQQFDLLATKNSNKTSFYGKRLEGNIFSFSFKTEDKKLTSTSGLDVF